MSTAQAMEQHRHAVIEFRNQSDLAADGGLSLLRRAANVWRQNGIGAALQAHLPVLDVVSGLKEQKRERQAGGEAGNLSAGPRCNSDEIP